MNKPLKILVSCYACSPYKGSEPGMGWNFVVGLSKFHEVHVITEKEKWEKDISKYLNKHKLPNIHFYFIAKKRKRKLRKIWPPSYYWFYKDWQKKALQLAKQLNAIKRFDLIHQLNMVGYREPGYLWQLDPPFVWGPVGGTENVPWHLFSAFNWYGKLFYGGRNLINSYQKKHLKRPLLATQKPISTLITATPNVQKEALHLWGKHSEIITEIGSQSIYNTTINTRQENTPLKVVWSGQHTQGKALNILLKSLSLLNPEIQWELHILGIGKETDSWKALAHKLKISASCIWHGWVAKDQALSVMQGSHVLCITSLKDLTSTVTLEGISLGLPIICLNHCGFAHVVTRNCGIKIDLNTIPQIYNDFKAAIELLYTNESLRQQLANGALNRAKDFLWSEKIEKLNTIYSKLLT